MDKPSSKQQAMLDTFDQHMEAELSGNLDATMDTMTSTPHLHNIASMLGGSDYKGVRDFYANHLVGKFFPPDVTFTHLSRTLDDQQLVEEIVITFTHTEPVEWMLPNIPPTHKPVKIPLVVIVKFDGDKVAHEHIYWDQASVLIQVGLLKAEGLPMHGVDSANTLLAYYQEAPNNADPHQ